MGKLFSKTRSHSSSSKSDRYAVPDRQHMMESSDFPKLKQYPNIHSEAVNCVVPAQPGTCVTASKDNTSVVFDYDSGSLIQKWTAHEKEITKVIYSRRLNTVFTASRDTNVHMLMPRSPHPIATFSGHELVVNGLALSPDNKQICTGSRDNTVRIWDIDTGECKFKSQISRNLVTHICWSATADLIAQTSEDKEVKLFDSNTLHVIKNFPKKQHIQTWCDISEDNLYCVSCSNGFGTSGSEATLWDLRQGKILREYEGHAGSCNCVVFIPPEFAPGFNLIATSSNDCTLRLWDRDNSERCIFSLDIPGSGPFTSIGIVKDQKRLLVSTFNQGVYVLDVRTDMTDGPPVQLFKSIAF